MSAGEVKETLMGIGNFGGKKKKGQGQGLLRSYKGLKLYVLPLFSLSSPIVYYVPIRDWNSSRFIGIRSIFRNVYYVPIRDWNQSRWRSSCRLFRPRLLRSYKGLKQNFPHHLPVSRTHVYYVPIRDWNPFNKATAASTPFSSLLRSYKGLKL